MAAGSEKFSWKLFEQFGAVARRCERCGAEPLRVQDVGEHRRDYPSGKVTFTCVDCRHADVHKLVQETRWRLAEKATALSGRSQNAMSKGSSSGVCPEDSGGKTP